MDKTLFSEKMKLADLISANHALILLLPRLGIPLGFGDKSVAAVCEQYAISTHFFLLICNVYTFDTYTPSEHVLRNTDMSLLVPYLRASHYYYAKERLPHIQQHLTRITDRMDDRYGKMLMRFFMGYKDEVAEHFAYEENAVFPYIESLISGKEKIDFHIGEFAESHSNVEDTLNDLTQIIFKYLPGNISPAESIEVVFDIFELSADLNKHTLIEEKVLIPYVELLETEAL